MKLALFGGLYSNHLALEAALADAGRRAVDAVYCLGDMGAFGPHPDRVFPLLRDHGVRCLRGNYDDSIGHAKDDCQCGYTDPRDNHFAQISYDYTLANTSAENRAFLRTLPEHVRLEAGGVRVLLCHGSPRRVNEFVWQSGSSDAFLSKLCEDFAADVICGTHTGLHWTRTLGVQPSKAGPHDTAASEGCPPRWLNVGCLGRPANDGRTCVWYAVLTIGGAGHSVEFIPVEYDHDRLAAEMRAEGLPEEFVATVETGWWTTCLEVLPGKERRAGQW